MLANHRDLGVWFVLDFGMYLFLAQKWRHIPVLGNNVDQEYPFLAKFFTFLWRSTNEVEVLLRSISDGICRRCDKKQHRRRGSRRVQLADRVVNKIQRPYYCPYLGHQNEIIIVRGISERRPTNTTHHSPTFQHEAIRVSANSCKVSGWV